MSQGGKRHFTVEVAVTMRQKVVRSYVSAAIGP